jgi:hypothetical protein
MSLIRTWMEEQVKINQGMEATLKLHYYQVYALLYIILQICHCHHHHKKIIIENKKKIIIIIVKNII